MKTQAPFSGAGHPASHIQPFFLAVFFLSLEGPYGIVPRVTPRLSLLPWPPLREQPSGHRAEVSWFCLKVVIRPSLHPYIVWEFYSSHYLTVSGMIWYLSSGLLNSSEHFSKLSEWLPWKIWGEGKDILPLGWVIITPMIFSSWHRHTFFTLWPLPGAMESVHIEVVLNICIYVFLPLAVFALSSTDTSVTEVERIRLNCVQKS